MESNTFKDQNQMAFERTDLAVERTVMAANRTLMGWVRTALSLISFGFTIYKFLQVELHNAVQVDTTQVQPGRLGLFLVALGTVAVILGSLEYFQTLKHLDKLSKRNYRPFNYAFLIGLIVGLLGLFILITAFTNADFF